MQEILFKSGAVMWIDPGNATQLALLPVVAAALGGIVTQEELTEDV